MDEFYDLTLNDINADHYPHDPFPEIPISPPFPDQPGFLWVRDPGPFPNWRLIPDNEVYTESQLSLCRKETFEPPNEGLKLSEKWKPSDGLPEGWKLILGIDKYFPGGHAPAVGNAVRGKDTSRTKANVKDKKKGKAVTIEEVGESSAMGAIKGKGRTEFEPKKKHTGMLSRPADIENWGLDELPPGYEHPTARQPITTLDCAKCDENRNMDLPGNSWYPSDYEDGQARQLRRVWGPYDQHGGFDPQSSGPEGFSGGHMGIFPGGF